MAHEVEVCYGKKLLNVFVRGYKFKKEQPFRIYKEGDAFVVTGDEIEKMLKMTWFASDEAFARFSKKLRRLGIDDKLKEMGIEEGDIIRILDYEFEYTK